MKAVATEDPHVPQGKLRIADQLHACRMTGPGQRQREAPRGRWKMGGSRRGARGGLPRKGGLPAQARQIIYMPAPASASCWEAASAGPRRSPPENPGRRRTPWPATRPPRSGTALLLEGLPARQPHRCLPSQRRPSWPPREGPRRLWPASRGSAQQARSPRPCPRRHTV